MIPSLSLPGIDWPYELHAFHIHQAFHEFAHACITIRLHDGSGSDVNRLPGHRIQAVLGSVVQVNWPGLAGELIFFGHVQSITSETLLDGDELWQLIALSCGYQVCGKMSLFHSYQQPGQTLLDIIRQTCARNPEHLDYTVMGDIPALSQLHYLGIQWQQSSFAYLSALLGSYGIPVRWEDKTGCLRIGWESANNDALKAYRLADDAYLRWQRFQAAPARIPPAFTAVANTDWQQPHLRPASQAALEAETGLWLEFTTCNQFFDPGDLIHYQNADYLRVIAVDYEYHPGHDDLQVRVRGVVNTGRSYHPDPVVPVTNRLMARVIRTNQDPEHLGRIQVRFENHPAAVLDHAVWLPVLIPYQGQQAGWWLLPEPGNQVLVECLDVYQGLWAVTQTLRTQAIHHLPAQVTESEQQKLLQTSRNNAILFAARPSSTHPDQEEITLINGQNRLHLQYEGHRMKVAIMQSGQSVLTLTTDGKTSKIQLAASADITVKAGETLKLLGKKIVLAAESELILSARKKARIQAGKRLVIEGDPIDLNP